MWCRPCDGWCCYWRYIPAAFGGGTLGVSVSVEELECFKLNPHHVIHQQVSLSLINMVTSHRQRCNRRLYPILAVFFLLGHLIVWSPPSSGSLNDFHNVNGRHGSPIKPFWPWTVDHIRGLACVMGGVKVSTELIFMTFYSTQRDNKKNRGIDSVLHLKSYTQPSVYKYIWT